jgi:hypothetical protein
VFGDGLLDASLDLLEGGLVGCGQGRAVFVAGLLGLGHRSMCKLEGFRKLGISV